MGPIYRKFEKVGKTEHAVSLPGGSAVTRECGRSYFFPIFSFSLPTSGRGWRTATASEEASGTREACGFQSLSGLCFQSPQVEGAEREL